MRKYSSFISIIFLLATAVVTIQLFETYSSGESTAEVRSENETSSERASISHDALVQADSEQTVMEITVTDAKIERISPGFTLVPMTGEGKVVLINTAGEILHTWEVDALRVRLLPNGNLLAIHGTKWGMKIPKWKKLAKVIREYSWNGDVVWEYQSSNRIHHDVATLPNGNHLFLERAPTIIQPPLEPKLRSILGTLPRQLRSDSIVELSKEREVVWTWNAHEHLDVYSCGARRCGSMHEKKSIREEHIDWTHTNTLTVIPENKWYRGGDTRFKPGNLLVLPRNFWQVLLVDRASKDVVWRFPEGRTKIPLRGDRLVRGHEAHMIHEPLPGAGNILVFDNGLDDVREYSIVRELNPQTKETVWRYEDRKEFFGKAGGSLQRFANGNTLISQDRGNGRIFEITKDKEIVWDVTLSHNPARANKYLPDYCPQFASL